MVAVKKVVLDILKPHQPNGLEFCRGIAAVGSDYRVQLTVLEMDENTESLRLQVEGSALDFEAIHAEITALGGSLHSIDEVEVHSDAGTD